MRNKVDTHRPKWYEAKEESRLFILDYRCSQLPANSKNLSLTRNETMERGNLIYALIPME